MAGAKSRKKRADASPPEDEAEYGDQRARFPVMRRRLLGWFEKNARDYPWRGTSNWFHLLMAEMMLRRTRADQVLPVYREFTRRFPRAADAAKLKPADVEKLLEPLGLRWRATQVHATIAHVRDSFAARAPAPEDDLLSIPGVGEYANAMLRNRLFDERVAAVDSNVTRIILRWRDKPFHHDSRRNRELIATANAFVNSKHSRDLNLALLDLSALVCRPARPRCPVCPLHAHCATATKNAETDPAPRKKKN